MPGARYRARREARVKLITSIILMGMALIQLGVNHYMTNLCNATDASNPLWICRVTGRVPNTK